MTLNDIAKRLGCTYSNASWLLRHGVLHGVKQDGHWIVTDDAIKDYLHRERRTSHPTYLLHTGDTFSFWTVLKPDLYNKQGLRVALCRCICGREKLVTVSSLIHGRSKSCGCKRHLNQTPEQKEGLKKGQKIMQVIRKEKAVAGLRHTLNKNSTTGHNGVSFIPKRGVYRAYIMVHRKQISLGCFASLEAAILARKAAEEKYLTSYREKVEEIKNGKP